MIVCALAVVGWFLADAGSHGQTRDALRVGALGWLSAHMSGVTIRGTTITAAPLLVTLGVAWSVWRSARRVGEAVSGHGPDALRISDGERDWTVPSATAVFTTTYLLLLVIVHRLAADVADPSLLRAAAFSLVMCLALGGTAVATGSAPPCGRRSCRSACDRPAASPPRSCACTPQQPAATFAIALVLDLAAAANILSQLDTDAGDTVTVAALSLLLVPNAVAFSGAYLLGPGFAVGAGTLVSPTAVVLGPLPLFPLLAALPGDGAVPVWVPALMAVPVLVSAGAAHRTLHRIEVDRWDLGALWGAAGGMLAAFGVALAALLSGGTVGPGRMAHVGPQAFDVLVHAVPALALGGALGGALAVWRTRRAAA